MTYIRKDYNHNLILYLCLFINTLLYTIMTSLIVFQSLILIKFWIIKSIILFLHKYGVFHYLFSFIVSIFSWYWNYPLGFDEEKNLKVSQENPENAEKKEAGFTTKDCVIIGVCVGVFSIMTGLKFLNEYYPEAIPALQGAVCAAGVTLATWIQKAFQSISEVSTSGSEHAEVGLKKSSLNWEAAKANAPSPEAFIAISRAEVTFALFKILKVNPESYHDTIILLRAHKVPYTSLLTAYDVYEEIEKVYAKFRVGGWKCPPIYARRLSEIDIIFYDSLFSIHSSKLRE